MTDRVLILGVGAIGGVLAARLIEAGYSPSLVTGNPHIARAINENGIVLPTESAVVSVASRAVVHLAELSDHDRFDVVLLATKTYDAIDALRDAMPYLSPSAMVAPLQNGLIEARLEPILGEIGLVGCLLNWAATMHAPGVYEQTVLGQTVIGEWSRCTPTGLGRIEAILLCVGHVSISENIIGAQWSKLAINCAVTVLCGLTGMRLGEPQMRAQAEDLFLAIYREAAMVAEAEGILLETLKYDAAGAWEPDGSEPLGQWVNDMVTHYGASLPSVVQSLQSGRPTEVDAISGHVVQTAERHGLDAPLNAALVAMIHEIEQGLRGFGLGNLDELRRVLITPSQRQL